LSATASATACAPATIAVARASPRRGNL
jgi:hypothetical protein